MVDVEDHVSFTHVEVPGDHRGGVDDLDQQLDETPEEMNTHATSHELYITSPHDEPHLMWRSFEDAGALVDGFRPQFDAVVLQFLGGSVQRFGNQAALGNLAL